MNWLVSVVKKRPFLSAFVVGVLVITLSRPLLRKIPPAPDVIAPIFEFELTNQFSEKFGSNELKGKAYVANFIFTSCQTVCPMSSANMQKLISRFDEKKISINFVSFSVDPEFDTPKVLSEYGEKYGASRPWYFLTSSRQNMEQTLKSFLLSLENKVQNEVGLMDIAHSSKFALVDAKGGLRGFYDSSSEGLDELFHTTSNLVRYFDAGL
jgi:protein SCO1